MHGVSGFNGLAELLLLFFANDCYVSFVEVGQRLCVKYCRPYCVLLRRIQTHEKFVGFFFFENTSYFLHCSTLTVAGACITW